MSQQENNPEVLVSVPGELEASMIISALAAEHVDATATGTYTSGFRAEAPGLVQVLVRRRDLARAKTILQDFMPLQKAESTKSHAMGPSQEPRSGHLSAWLLLLLVAVALVLRFWSSFTGS